MQCLLVSDLLAAPERFDAQVVTVLGFYVGEREEHAIYPSPEEAGTRSRGVWLHHEATAGGRRAIARLSQGWVRLAGVFHNRRRSGAGHFNAYLAYISGIKTFEAADRTAESRK